jgi:beta-1,2-mannobiose phosphorylase / 1,2-beta-oligomannan phosphorylase
MERSLRQLLISPADLAASRDDFEVIGAFNPGAVRTPEGVVLLMRVAERPRERRGGFTGLPRWEEGRGIIVDWIANDELDLIDPRVVKIKSSGLRRLTFISHLRVVRSADGVTISDFSGLVFGSELPLEEYGVEDPRITPLDGRYYITYVAVSRHGVVTALASTEDFRDFTRHGVIFAPENKDVVLFPERICGQFAVIHRPSGGAGFARPQMWLARSPDLLHWGHHAHLLAPDSAWDAQRNGAGPPPVRTPEGWLFIYHGCSQATEGVGVYSAGAMLLDANDPCRILRRTREPFLSPELLFEREGFVPNVVFPTGIVEDADSYLVYYGAADTCTGVVRVPRNEII